MQKDPKNRHWNADIISIRHKNQGNTPLTNRVRKPVADISVPKTKHIQQVRPKAQLEKPQQSIIQKNQIDFKPKSKQITKPKSNNQLEIVDDLVLEDVSKTMYKPNNYKYAQKMAMTEHIAEFRRRSLWCMLALFIGGIIGYKYQEQIIVWLVKPLGQQLFYTSPTGGFDFLIKICLFFGFILAVPVIIYNFFKYISPAIPAHITYSFVKIIVVSIISALAGVAFAYFVSLPAALHFLNNFSNQQVTSLISAQEYFNFVMLYMAGFALLFQMPLVFSFINKVKPLKPARLFKQQRVVILVSFIIAAILTPTPDPINQTLMAAPIIALYQTSIGVVWRENKRKGNKKFNNTQLSFS